MFNRFATCRPPAITNRQTRTRRFAIGAAAVIPALLMGVLGGTHPAAPIAKRRVWVWRVEKRLNMTGVPFFRSARQRG